MASVLCTLQSSLSLLIHHTTQTHSACIANQQITHNSVEELIAQNALFADFKAVKDGNVWTTGKSLHQATDDLGSMTKDINTMLVDENAEELTFMKRLH